MCKEANDCRMLEFRGTDLAGMARHSAETRIPYRGAFSRSKLLRTQPLSLALSYCCAASGGMKERHFDRTVKSELSPLIPGNLTRLWIEARHQRTQILSFKRSPTSNLWQSNDKAAGNSDHSY
jgi:hypothetical protein